MLTFPERPAAAATEARREVGAAAVVVGVGVVGPRRGEEAAAGAAERGALDFDGAVFFFVFVFVFVIGGRTGLVENGGGRRGREREEGRKERSERCDGDERRRRRRKREERTRPRNSSFRRLFSRSSPLLFSSVLAPPFSTLHQKDSKLDAPGTERRAVGRVFAPNESK